MKVLEKTAALAMRKVTRSAGIGCANRSALEIGVFMKVASICWHSWTARRDWLTVVAVVVSAVGWIVKVARGLHQYQRRLGRSSTGLDVRFVRVGVGTAK